MLILNNAIQSYHSDGAHELMGEETQKFLGSKGIKMTHTVPYAPQENAFIERHFRTEAEKTIAMMLHARYIPKEFWFHAKETFNYIYNRIPTTTSKGTMSPFEHVNGKPPDIFNIRVWGSKAYINIPLAKRKKDLSGSPNGI